MQDGKEGSPGDVICNWRYYHEHEHEAHLPNDGLHSVSYRRNTQIAGVEASTARAVIVFIASCFSFAGPIMRTRQPS